MSKFLTAREAAAMIPDHATIGFAGMGLSGWPEEIAQEIANHFKETGHPRGLNIKQGSAMGDWRERGITRLGLEGLVAKWSAAHIGSAFALCELASANKIECHCLPQGIIVNLWREIAAHRPGLITQVGLGTFIDPRIEGGRMNECTKENIAELIQFQGKEYLFYKSFPLDVALLRGTTADEDGNITFDKESVLNEGLAVAEAAKNSGGIVIVQVEYAAKRGTLHPKSVKIPGILVDYVVVATKQEASWQTEGVYYEPSFSGEMIKPLDMIPKLEMSERKIIARRCAMELRKGNVVNLGVGMSSDVANVVAEEGYSEAITLTGEAGAVGGIPASLPNFGSSYNPQAIIEHGAMFDMIDGGGLDVTCLGLGQADKYGNINVSKFGKRLIGPGGFINITSSAKKVIFCGTIMDKAKIEINDGQIIIVEEGSNKKFLDHVEQITFAGKYKKPGQKVLYVTERCVFELIDGEMTMVEIAPGMDLERNIFAHMDFVPRISQELKIMDREIFAQNWNKLGRTILKERV